MLTKTNGFRDAKTIKALYNEAFPKKERLPFFFLRLFCQSKARCTSYRADGAISAFTVTVETDRAVFLVFLAVDAKERSKGIGSSVIRDLKSAIGSKILVADIEDPNTECENILQRKRRLAFYEKNGMTLSGYTLSEYCGDLLLVSSAPLQQADVDALAKKASFLKWRYRLTDARLWGDDVQPFG